MSAFALIVLGLAWEMWLAPLRPGGSLLGLKVLPLCLAVLPLWRGHRRTHQWWSMLVLAYLCEGIVRAFTDAAPSRTLAWIEVALATTLYMAVLAYLRKPRQHGCRADAEAGTNAGTNAGTGTAADTGTGTGTEATRQAGKADR